MENGREVKKSFCLLSVAYIVLGLVLVIWPDISVHTFCFVFGIGMIIFGERERKKAEIEKNRADSLEKKYILLEQKLEELGVTMPV